MQPHRSPQEPSEYTLCEGRAYRALQRMAELTYFHHQTLHKVCAAIPHASYVERPSFDNRDWYGMIRLGSEENNLLICIPWQSPKRTEKPTWRIQVYCRHGAQLEDIATATRDVAKTWAKQFREANSHLPIPLYVANL